MAKISGNHQKLEDTKEDCYLESSNGEHGPANTLISDFWTPEL